MSEQLTKEQILESKIDSRFAIQMPFNYSHIYEAMSEYAASQAKELSDRVKELEEGLRDILKHNPFTPNPEYYPEFGQTIETAKQLLTKQ